MKTMMKSVFAVALGAMIAPSAFAQWGGYPGGGWGGRGPGGRGPGGGWGGRDTTVTCESINYRPNNCYVGGPIRNAYIVNQRSNSPCIQGRSWGYDRNSIWVADGCRATFGVDFGGWR